MAKEGVLSEAVVPTLVSCANWLEGRDRTKIWKRKSFWDLIRILLRNLSLKRVQECFIGKNHFVLRMPWDLYMVLFSMVKDQKYLNGCMFGINVSDFQWKVNTCQAG